MVKSAFSAARYGTPAALLGLVLLGWCVASATWSVADFARPPAYIEDLSKSDIITGFAALKANAAGEALPFLWKRVSRLNAPFQAEWNDWPILDELQGLATALLGRTLGIFGGLNAAFLLGHLLAAGTFYGVARASGASYRWSFVGGLAYGLSPFMFAQSPHHAGVQWAWHVPLFTLVWRWAASDPGIEPGSKRFAQATGIGLLSGLLNIYYTNILCQLTLLGAGVQYLRNRQRSVFVGALAVVGAAAIGFAGSNVDTWTYRALNGANTGAVVREYKWLEIYGLKIKDLFIPPVTHRADAFANFGINHRKEAVLNDEDGCPYQGIVGLACLIWLVGTSALAVIRRRESEIPPEAWQLLWIVIMFTTGGLNAIIGALGFTMFRTGTRYSIVILAITLLWAARRLTMLEAKAEVRQPADGMRHLWTAAAVGLCGLICWDQVPRAPSRDKLAEIDRHVAADREFAGNMEAALPAGAMVFQLPVMEFPESPIPGVPAYDHFRPYIFSKNLRFSFGSHKGRDREKWQPAVQGKLFEGATLDRQAGIIVLNEANARAAIEELKRLGFSALYVNRNGFPDRGNGLVKTLQNLGYTRPPIESAAGDLVCVPLTR